MDALLEGFNAHADDYCAVTHQIWEGAEVGNQEEQGSKLLMETCEREGFAIDGGLAAIPTAFVAEYGIDAPVIGVLAEYDALSGLSQSAISQ